MIPRAIDYFTGKAIEYDMQEYDSDAEDDDFHGLGDDDDDDVSSPTSAFCLQKIKPWIV